MRLNKVKKDIDYGLFSNVKTANGNCIKILGIKVCEIFSGENFRIQKFLNGFIYTKRVRTLLQEKKVYKILRFPIVERILKDDIITYSIFNKKVRQIDLQDLFYKKYLKNLSIEYDDVYILHANSGETYLFFAYCVKSVLKKNNSQKPIFIATQDYHVDILKMYLPDANCIYLEDFYNTRAKRNKWYVKGHNCYMIFSSNHFHTVEKDAHNKEIGEVHYLNSINKTLEISEKDYTKPIVNISQEVKQNLNDKIRLLNLNLNNFVVIAPEAQTCEELPVSLWTNIVKELKQRGYDVFLNVVKKDNFIEGCKSVFLNYQEAFALAKKAKAVISLRSGFSEFLLPTGIPNITVYTKFRERKKWAFSVAKTISAFTMHKLPFVNHDLICELNIDDFKNEGQLLRVIMEIFDSRVVREAQVV